jgi:Tol biopolymer transport system component
VGPLPGDNYVLVYQEGDAIRRLDTRVGTDQAVVMGVDTLLFAAPSLSGGNAAFVSAKGDSLRAHAVNLESGTLTEVHADETGTGYTAAWSTDGERLAVGFRPESGRGGVVVLDSDGAVRNIGCRASDRVEAWRSESQVVVHDAVNFYTVSTSNCSTLARFSKPGKNSPAFSASGNRVAYFADRSVRFANRAQPQVIPELWVADHDGSGAAVVADHQSRARNAVLSPDAHRVAYEVVSRRWANTTHVVIYEVRSKAYSYIAEEKPLGVPNDFGACWSPDGRRIAHQRTYARSTGTQAYTTRQVVVRSGKQETVAFEEIISEPPAQVAANAGARCQWMGPRHLLLDSRNGQRVVDVDDGETLEVPVDRRVLAVRVFEGGQ